VKRLCFVSLFCCLAFISTLHADDLKLVNTGFAQFRAAGASAALDSWTFESRWLTPDSLKETRENLVAAQKLLGDCLRHQIVLNQDVGGGSRVVCASAQLRAGTLFFRFVVFQDTLGQQYINGLRWSADPQEVWPESLCIRGR
jgi:hypothetical protein